MAKKRGNAGTATNPRTVRQAETYTHPEASAMLRPEVGTQPQFKKSKPPAKYRYDDSLAPELNWDGQNPAREIGEWLLGLVEKAVSVQQSAVSPATATPFPATFKNSRGETVVEVRSLKEAIDRLKAMSGAFLNWAGKAERLSFDVPTLPLFIHERLSTKAILETLKGHRRDKQLGLFELFGDRQHPIHEQVLRAYEHRNGWVNRMVLGDSLVVMNSLLHYEGLGGQMQMIYIDPPYGVKFGSNFQPFVRKRDVKHNDDEDMTREPEMVKAYRDTWELGLHSYLTYLRDRLLLARELLSPSGSVFVQIGDENLHHVREIMDEIFGPQNAINQIVCQKSSGRVSESVDAVYDTLLWYTRDKERLKFRKLFRARTRDQIDTAYNYVQLRDGSSRPMTRKELEGEMDLPPEAKRFRPSQMYSQTGGDSSRFTVQFADKSFGAPASGGWRTNHAGVLSLIAANRVMERGTYLAFKMMADDFPFIQLHNVWTDALFTAFGTEKAYVVQTAPRIVERCMLMTTDPGDLVLDPTCGSGTTAYVAEQWGRRWITIDTSRVPLALARQRLLTTTFSYYELKDESRGPAGGFMYTRKQNNKGEDVGGIVPHVTLKSIANSEPPEEEVLVDRPEEDNKTTRVTGPFCFEATIPTPVNWEDESGGTGVSSVQSEGHGRDAHATGQGFLDRMLEVLRKSPVLHVGGGKSVTLKNVRRPAKTLTLSAEAMVEGHAPGSPISLDGALQVSAEQSGKSLPFTHTPVAIIFGPENGAISQKSVFEAAMEARAKGYAHLYVIGFAIQPQAREAIEKAEHAYGMATTYVQATPDLLMGDLLKNMRSSQIFSVCGLPEVKLHKAQREAVAKMTGDEPKNITGQWWQVELLGLDVFDPTTMETDHRPGDDVPCWLLDTDYNGLSFHVSQAFFPRTSAWDSIKKALKGEYDEGVWEHLAGTTSAPFEMGEHKQVAVKVIDDRGNELMVVKGIREVK